MSYESLRLAGALVAARRVDAGLTKEAEVKAMIVQKLRQLGGIGMGPARLSTEEAKEVARLGQRAKANRLAAQGTHSVGEVDAFHQLARDDERAQLAMLRKALKEHGKKKERRGAAYIAAGTAAAASPAVAVPLAKKDKLKNAQDLRAMAQLVAANRVKTANQVSAAGHAAKVLSKLPGGIRQAFKEMGEQVTKGVAVDPTAPGTAAKVLGGAVRHVPTAGAVLGAGYVAKPHVEPYVQSKVRQYRVRQAMTRPHFDPRTQRFM